MLSKLLLLVLVFVAGAIFWRAAQRSGAQRPGPQPPPAGRAPERMLRCPHCGVHFPVSEGVVRDGQGYCCEAHAASHE